MIELQHIHPMVVHFPIVFIIALAAYDMWQAASGRQLQPGGGALGVSAWLAIFAGLSALVAFAFGDAAMDVAMDSGVAEAIIEPHEGMGAATAIAAAVWALIRLYLWRRGDPVAGRTRLGVIAVELVLAGMVVVTAYFGGELVYAHGLAVVASAG